MGPTAARLLLLLLLVAASLVPAPASSTADAPASASAYAAARCAATIVSISPCLPHVAAVAPPLAASPPAPTDACCVAFLRAVNPSGGGGGDGCLCHLLRNPFLLGFPVDAALLGTLLPACAAAKSFAGPPPCRRPASDPYFRVLTSPTSLASAPCFSAAHVSDHQLPRVILLSCEFKGSLVVISAKTRQ